jgi:hypothetical protein
MLFAALKTSSLEGHFSGATEEFSSPGRDFSRANTRREKISRQTLSHPNDSGYLLRARSNTNPLRRVF